ncbi:uncharacterized protein LOC118202452 [Stegodyphus dumicola]|uniref:uncharacterized protein LOC118202452 n=1 Tax=Stegodyphus dumicola TaxID=202533 RepID=UPI0015AA2FE3|nr:uncharacterized protein LOC118202452 [Stegodyphus dumicola]
MQHDNTLYLKYRETLEEYLNQGIIERILDSTKPVNKPVFYMPHQAVYREESITTKMRIVFDASSHEIGSLSLNDCLWPGINLNQNIFHLLIYFRFNRVSILGDIEKAFLQIVLAEKDRDAVRFLFVKNIDTPLQNTDDQLEVYRFKRVLFGVNSSPFLLAATIKLHIQKYRNVYPDTFQILDTCMYVDDLVTGADDVSEALKTSREAKEIMRGAGMNLRKWVTNDYHLAKKWEEENFDIHPLSSNERILKVLGIQWNIQEDNLSIETSCLTKISRRKKSTKRFILQTAGKIYDPLGLITPFTVRIKLLLQKLWLRKLPWDEELPSDLNDEWSQWCSELSELSNISVPRFALDSCDENIEIHVFSDASQKLYGAAVYVKSRVSPVKKVSLPRLKLLGALIAARLGTEVKKVLDRKGSSNIFFWSDSKVTLYWIKGSSRRWKSFVQNRVDEIQKLTNPDSWFYCSTKDNPADLLTHGVSASSLVNNSKWFICNCRKGESRKVGPLQLEEVKGILNSRPLTPISNDFDCYDVLTPGHFLIGRSIQTIPEPMIIDVNKNRLSRWQRTTKVVQIIWKKWSNDYLGTLQQRNKWMIEKDNISVGTMVLVKEDYLPICKWILCRVIKVYHGSDNKVRTVKIKTKSGELKKSDNKDRRSSDRKLK